MKRPDRSFVTPIRIALATDSSLRACVADGMGAVDAAHHILFEASVRTSFVDSLNLDNATKCGHEQEHRWDYLIGHAPTGAVVAVEPHSAKDGAVTAVIKKRRAALRQLHTHLRDGIKVKHWLWVSPGKVHFANTERVVRHLEQNGIEFVGTRVMAKHLCLATPKSIAFRHRKQ